MSSSDLDSCLDGSQRPAQATAQAGAGSARPVNLDNSEAMRLGFKNKRSFIHITGNIHFKTAIRKNFAKNLLP